MIEVNEREDGSLDISWDPNDPRESIFNAWSEEDFIKHITEYCDRIVKNGTNREGENIS